MRKWIKHSMLIVALLMALAALCLSGAFVLFRGTPNYYRKSQLTPEQLAAAATSAESKLFEMHNLVADAHGAELQNLHGATRPIAIPGARTFVFTADEMNALFNKWAELHGWKDLLDSVVEDPMIVLKDHRVIFAGKVNVETVDTIVSIHIQPSITPDGKLSLKLVSILGGKLPLPKETMIAPMRKKVIAQIVKDLPAWQARADIHQDGGANDSAMKAAMGKLLLHMLSDEPAEPMLFLPLLSRGDATVPVKLSDISIDHGAMTLTVVPLDSKGCEQLLEQIKRPVESDHLELNPTN